MNVKVSSKIYVHDASKEFEDWCRNELVLDNPDYFKKESMGKWTGNTPKNIFLYEKAGHDLCLPFGCLQDVWKLIGKSGSWSALFASIRRFNYASHIDLYPYQEKAVNEAITKKNGILVMPCGSGKTQSGLEIISRIGGRALWLTHTQDLLNQSRKRAESVLGNVGVGTITGGKVHLGNGITFATVQTMCRLDLTDYRDYWDVVIVDECQHCCGTPTKVTQFYKVISRLCARYKIGLTATPKRADGLERAMFALLGDVIHEVSREEVADTTCPVKVLQIETGWFPDYDCILMGDGTIDYHKVVDAMTQDLERFGKVVDIIKDLGDAPKIILANRVEYLQRLCNEFGDDAVCISGMSQSKSAKEARKEILNRLNDGEINAVFATYQLAKEGLDVPNLRYIVFATPEKDETTVIQSAGRVGRKADGKDRGVVIDLVDGYFGMYKGWARKRKSCYRKIDADVVEFPELPENIGLTSILKNY